MEQYTDEQIIEGIFQNDRKVMDYIYDQFYGKVEGFIMGRGGNPEHIKDVFQEALMVIIQKVRKENLKLKASLDTYLKSRKKGTKLGNIYFNRYFKKKDETLA